MDPTHSLHNPPTQTEAGRLLSIAEKLLVSRDLTGAREFALLAQEMDPLIEGSDQILAIAEVILASEKRVNNNRHQDWYSILQIERPLVASEPDLLRRNYRRLALLLHPDKNNFPLADTAFKFVADAWAVLSDPAKRTPYDHELSLFDLRPQPPASSDKLPVRRSGVDDGNNFNNNHATPTTTTTTMPPPHGASGNSNPRGKVGRGRVSNFWTTCPYCYVLYEYPKVYEECCIRCQNCERAFHAASIPSLPPMVPGKEAYYCCWGFFPLGFSLESESNSKGRKGGSNNQQTDNNNNNVAGQNTGFPNWMPGMFTTPMAAAQGGGLNVNAGGSGGGGGGGGINVDFSDGSGAASMGYDGNVGAGYGNSMPGMGTPGPKKRGRPRKNPFPV